MTDPDLSTVKALIADDRAEVRQLLADALRHVGVTDVEGIAADVGGVRLVALIARHSDTDLETTETDRVRVAENVLLANNRPNPVTDPEDILALLPAGVGLLNVGGDGVEAFGNLAAGNDSAGIAVFQLPPDAASLDPRIDPFPDRNQIRGNVCLGNGRNVDPKFGPLPGADLVWDTSGTGNCWTNNLARTTFPDPLPDCR